MKKQLLLTALLATTAFAAQASTITDTLLEAAAVTSMGACIGAATSFFSYMIGDIVHTAGGNISPYYESRAATAAASGARWGAFCFGSVYLLERSNLISDRVAQEGTLPLIVAGAIGTSMAIFNDQRALEAAWKRNQPAPQNAINRGWVPGVKTATILP